MAADAQVIRRAWDASHVEALMPSVLASPWPLEGARDVLQGALLYEFSQGRSHALLAVRPVPLAGGLRLDVVGLVSDGERLQGAAIDAAAVQVARSLGCQALAMCTVSAHVEKVCARTGWERAGVVMQKRVGHVQ
ncbi:hypothetical protein AVHY2522_22920 [Acidovorax sp. SUPP2522]|uniref:hypothetical protein n=1 Tax=unclassified Acidovorax TaxID=2684926 RepID=UPI0023491846|nr:MULTISPECIES: hypothetical protein [unclassified Acidovorax]WCM95720.1 hypothetical protein M5C96_14655 [Acidovorax sp. GBBC 1281]GKT19558.1 hypothetical protein AVHY2522_22920 [Acidovorax sp. SUPP2522]